MGRSGRATSVPAFAFASDSLATNDATRSWRRADRRRTTSRSHAPVASLLHTELLVEVTDRRRVGTCPRRMPEESVNLVRNHHLLVADSGRRQPPREVDGFVEVNVAVVISLDQQDRT